MALRWGIAGAGKISNDFVQAVRVHPSTDHQVLAVAARSQITADTFAKTHNIPNAYEGYQKLAQDRNVDIVYVGVIHPQHYVVTKLMLENGKHVLCEKPFTMNEKQTRKLIEISRANKLFLMDGIWSRCFPVYRELKNIIESGEIGEVVQVTVEFGASIAEVERVKSKELGGGATLDLGVYILQFQQYIFRGLKPLKVIASGHLNAEGVDSSISAIITYPGSKTAFFSLTCLRITMAYNRNLRLTTKLRIFNKYPEEMKCIALPTYEDVISYYEWVRHEMKQSNMQEPAAKEISSRVTKKVVRIWQKSSIPTVSSTRVSQLILTYCAEYRQLLKNVNRHNKKNHTWFRRKIERAQTKVKNTEPVPSTSRQLSENSTDESEILTNEEEYNEPTPTCSTFSESQKKKKLTPLTFEKLSETYDRYGVSYIAGAAIASTALQDVNSISKNKSSYVIDHSKLRRDRIRRRNKLMKNRKFTDIEALFFDGRKDKTMYFVRKGLKLYRIVYGTKGCIKIDSFWCPTTIEVNGKLQTFPLMESKGNFIYQNSVGLAYEAEEARKCIKEGKLESVHITHEESIELAQLMDKLRQDVGVVFPADSENY
ncbi:hypothetical protein NQ314_000705 [Rhamnusium bicolor]|uniref:Trans-1,2-dihydrobenzene-1,2-diol dehydrogenase n=1 Tax=Rhamnusium bicolor TaxID=1586634 RepID=A0AAV8ZXF3_9CUCU|nr:hypothetical protein NQ314_000705 [Rhamnusium bicolor]